MKTSPLLAALAALCLFNPNPARASEPAVAPAGFTDADADGVLDSADKCVETAPVPAGALINSATGCWMEADSCVLFRLQHGGDIRACGSPKWDAADEEAVRGVNWRQDVAGRLLPVNGKLVVHTDAGWKCTEPQAYLYVGGKVTKAGKDAGFSSAFGPEQPPACSYSRLEATPTAGSVAGATALAQEAREGLDGLGTRVTGLDGRIGAVETEQATAKEWRKKKDEKDAEQDRGLKALGKVDEEVGKTLVTHGQAIGRQARHGGFVRLGLMASGYGIEDGLKMAGYRIHIDPHGGLRLSFGYRYLNARSRLLVLAAANGDLHWNRGVGGPGTLRGGAGLGGQVGAYGFPVWGKEFAMGLGGDAEVRGEWFNLSSVDFAGLEPVLHSGTLVVAPHFGAVGLFGAQKIVGLQVNLGAQVATTWLPDGSKISSTQGALPPVDLQVLGLVRF